MTDTLDTSGAAELLHVSISTVQAMARAGEIPATQIAGSWLFIKQDLIDCIRARAADEQKERREIALQMANIAAPIRSRGRPRKIKAVERLGGENSGLGL